MPGVGPDLRLAGRGVGPDHLIGHVDHGVFVAQPGEDPLHRVPLFARRIQAACRISSIIGLNGPHLRRTRRRFLPRLRSSRGHRLDHRTQPDAVLAFRRTPGQPSTGIPGGSPSTNILPPQAIPRGSNATNTGPTTAPGAVTTDQQLRSLRAGRITRSCSTVPDTPCGTRPTPSCPADCRVLRQAAGRVRGSGSSGTENPPLAQRGLMRALISYPDWRAHPR
ncbi:hypothetical protein C8D88_102866 [Lentzea atacamensis]|uniref:Uncharacterized protein n=1 Tax=Lentzea atacamensis TaxID=531938 RepID=A0A316I8Q2_9PSEU|nr:hypothetical protein C8D88_102866 [Lentzea atacamensis]